MGYGRSSFTTVGLGKWVELGPLEGDRKRELISLSQHRSSFSTFEELPDVIVGVGLVKPRPGVFVDSISHLLVLTTPNAITLVGLGYSGSPKEITFYLTGLSVPTDGISLTIIKGTSNGRIFLASSPEALTTPGGIGGDGCLYELVYQSAEGWFVKRCTLHNLSSGSIAKSVMPSFLRSLSAINSSEWVIELQVDNERGLLYTLLRNGTIEMYQLLSTSPGSGFDGPPHKVAKSGDILRQALVICPGSPMLNARNFKIVSLEIVSVKEGGNVKIGLVAITSTGLSIFPSSPSPSLPNNIHPITRCPTLLFPSATRLLLLLCLSSTLRSRTLSRPPTTLPILLFRPLPTPPTTISTTSLPNSHNSLQQRNPSQIRIWRSPPSQQQPNSRYRHSPPSRPRRSSSSSFGS